MVKAFLLSLLIIPSLAFPDLPANPSLAFHDLAVNIDQESGELMKPTNWSDTRFQMLKMIRLRDLLQETMKGVSKAPELFPEDPSISSEKRRRRKKRSVGAATTPFMHQGLYKQEKSLLPKILEVESPSIHTQNNGLFFGTYQGDTPTDLMFQVSHLGNIQVCSIPTISSSLVCSSLSGTFNVDVGAGVGAISDVVLGYDPVQDVHYVAVAVNHAVIWPRVIIDKSKDGKFKDEVEYMTINDPVEMPAEGKSRVYKFKMTGSNFVVDLVKTVNTIEALDAEFWTEDDDLYLAFAHRGNYTTETEDTQSVLLKHQFYDSTKFEVTQGYQGIDNNGDQILTGLNLVTHNPRSVIQFDINSRSFLVFANRDAKYPVGSSDTFSPIYRYNIKTELYELYQELPTFAAEDVSFFQITDPGNSLNTQSFLVFANNRDAVNKPIESFIFKYIDGKFLPFQGLFVDRPISVTSFTNVLTPTDSTVRVLEHFVVFLTEASTLVFFQFDGVRFHEVVVTTDTNSLKGATDVDTVILNEGSLLRVRHANKDELFTVKFDMSGTLAFDITGAFNTLFASSNALLSYVDYWMKYRPDFPGLQAKYDIAPRSGEDQISVTDADFSGTMKVWDIIIDPKLALDTSVDPALKVTKKTSIDSNLLTSLEEQVSGTETENLKSCSKLKATLDSYEAEIAKGAKLNDDNVLKQGLHIDEVEVVNRLQTAKTVIDVAGSVVTDTVTKNKFDLVSYMDNAVINDGSSITFSSDVKFEKLRIEDEYSIYKLNDVMIHKYVNTGDLKDIDETITFDKEVVFKGDVTVDGMVDGIELSTSRMLLKTGDQTIVDAVELKGNAVLNDVTADVINNFDLSILNTALMVGEAMSTTGIKTLTVDELEIQGAVTTTDDQLGILSSTLALTSTVHLGDLVEHSMKKSKDNTISIPCKFDKVTANGNLLINSKMNSLVFPDDFVPISENNAPLTRTATLVFPDNINSVAAISVATSSKISSGPWTNVNGIFSPPSSSSVQEVSVDSDKNLDLLLLGSASYGITNYKHTVTGRKKFDAVLFQDDVDVSGTVLGYDMVDVKNDNAAGKKVFSQGYSVTDLVLTGSQDISSLLLDNKIIQTSCNGYSSSLPINADVSCTGSNDFEKVYTSGVRRDVDTIPGSIKSITFTGEAIFEKNLEVQTVNTADSSISYVDSKPSVDFMRRTGSGLFTLTQPMEFTGETTYDDDIAQSIDAEVSVCELSFNGQCLCNDCSDDRYCEYKAHHCLVKSGVTDSSLYAKKVTQKLSFIDNNALKVDTDQVIKPRLVLKAGFKADKLEVTSDDCTINSVSCSNIALISSDATFTGANTFYGTIGIKKSAQVNSVLTVTGTVDTIDTTTLYTDTLFKKSAMVQYVTGQTTINKDYSVATLTTNNVWLSSDAVWPSDLFSGDYVMRNAASASITSNLVFAAEPTLAQFVASSSSVTWDQVTMNNFFYNLWIDGKAQTISADVTVKGDLDLPLGLSTSVAIGRINNVDIKELETKALRISGAGVSADKRTLNEVTFKILKSTDGDGITMEDVGTFLGVDLSVTAVKNKNNGNLVFTGLKTFSSLLVVGNDLELTGNIVPVGSFSTIPQNQLWNFLNNDASVKKIKVTHADGASSTNEPTITDVNGHKLSTLRNSKWYKSDDVKLPYPINFGDVQFSSKLHATHLDNVDLASWSNNYLSLTKEQDITQKYTFSAGLTSSIPVSVANVDISIDGKTKSEGDLITTDHSHKFKEHYNKVLFKNVAYSTAAVLKPDDLDVSGALLMDTKVKINNVDLSEDVLTYKNDDTKTFTSKVAIDGDLVVTKGTGGNAGDLSLNSVYFYQSDAAAVVDIGTGIKRVSGNYMVQFDLLEADKISKAGDTSVEVKGDITIENNPTFLDLSASSFNAKNIGTCTLPNILTTDTCSSGVNQIMAEAVQFGTDSNPVEVTFAKIILVDNGDWTALMGRMISKTKPGSVEFTGKKTFIEDITISSMTPTTFSEPVFGLDLSKVIGDVQGSMDMNYPSDGDSVSVMPDLKTALKSIEVNSVDISNEFLFMLPIITEKTKNPNKRVRTLGMTNFFAENGVNDVDAWDKAPFQLASLERPRSNVQGSLSLYTVTYEEGRAVVSYVDPKLADSLVFGDGADGECDMVAMHSNGKYFYFLSTRTISLPESHYNYFMKWNEVSKEMEIKGFTKNTIVDLELIKFKGTDSGCFVVCGMRSLIHCVNSVDENLVEEQDLLNTDCFKASATSYVDTVKANGNAHMGNSLLALASGKGTNLGKVDIYKYKISSSTMKLSESIPCHYCSSASLGSYIDHQVSRTRTFLVIASFQADFVYVGEHNQATGKMEVYQKIEVPQPKEAHFYNRDNKLHISILAGSLFNSQVSTFVHQGSMGFVPVPDWTISLPGVTSHEVFPTFQKVNTDKFISHTFITTSGVPISPHVSPSLTPNTVMQALFKQTNIDSIRTQAAAKIPSIPKFISNDCKTMVTNYAKELYDVKTSGAHAEQYAKLLLRLFPRPYLKFSKESFTESVQSVLKEEEADYLVDDNAANAVVNFYKYNANVFTRDTTSTGYTGTAFIYQDLDGVLYIYSRFEKISNGYQKMKFMSTCESDATELDTTTFATSGPSVYNPVVSDHADGKTRQLCMMVHGFERSEELKAIKGKSYVGALQIYNQLNKKVACGLMKHPEQAMVQFLTDHGKEAIFNPFVQSR